MMIIMHRLTPEAPRLVATRTHAQDAPAARILWRWSWLPFLTFLLLNAGCWACDGPPAAGMARGPVTEPCPLPYHDPDSGLRFAPDRPVRVTARHFGVQAPGTIRSMYAVLDLRGTLLLTVDLWHNTERLPLGRWFERHLGFVRSEHTTISELPASPGPPGILIERGATSQAFGQTSAVVALADRVVRVSCQRSGDHGAMATFRRVLRTLELRR